MSAIIRSRTGRRTLGFSVATALLLTAAPQVAAAMEPAAPVAETVTSAPAKPARFSLFKRQKAHPPARRALTERQGEFSQNPSLNPMLTAPLEMPLGERRQRLLPTYG